MFDHAAIKLPRKAMAHLKTTTPFLHRVLYELEHGYKRGMDHAWLVHPRILMSTNFVEKKPRRQDKTINKHSALEMVRLAKAYRDQTEGSSWSQLIDLEAYLAPPQACSQKHLVEAVYEGWRK
jgi:hypothetical protein